SASDEPQSAETGAQRRSEPTVSNVSMQVKRGEGSASDEPQSAETGAQRRSEPTVSNVSMQVKRGEGSASDEPQSAETGAKRRSEPTVSSVVVETLLRLPAERPRGDHTSQCRHRRVVRVAEFLVESVEDRERGVQT